MCPCIVSIFQYIQQDAMLHILFISVNCSACFGWYLHPSSGAHTAVSTASGICHTVIAIFRYRGRVGTGLSVLWVAYACISPKAPDRRTPSISPKAPDRRTHSISPKDPDRRTPSISPKAPDRRTLCISL
jgi:hypothetical protein